VILLKNGQLRIPAVQVVASGQFHQLVLQHIPGKLPMTFELVSAEPPLGQNLSPAEADPTIEFRCNICGKTSQTPLSVVNNREAPSCTHCYSSLRMRSVVRALSLALFGESLAIPEFPKDKNILGLGMSDWEGYALPLAEKLGYTNTFYHENPRLDIMNLSGWPENNYDFVISSDVFEHIPPPVSIAFENVCQLLKPGGVFIFTVPFTKTGITQEYFPELHDYRIVTTEDGKRILVNCTRDGREQAFDNLVFHGGDGFTLEMRLFSEPCLSWFA
jgi:SAM-dependent methyltransferase